MADKKSFDKLREEYSEFIYKGYSIDERDGAYHVVYEFEIPGLSSFNAKWTFPKAALDSGSSSSSEASGRDIDIKNDRILNELIFSLGMVECISYYKITCPKLFGVECRSLSDKQCKWWSKLIYNGLGEFMYRNGIEVSEEELVRIKAPADQSDRLNDDAVVKQPDGEFIVCRTGSEESKRLHDDGSYEGFLVPVGGGKDSVVSLELLKGKDIVTYSVNGNSTTKAVIDVCGHKSGDYTAKRVLDKRMLELNAKGYLNGHTPFSAIVAFSSVISAYILGRQYVVLSNENSANESTVKDSFVNHQYSKSYEFERDFNEYLSDVTDSDIHYFSMLRPLTEMQIAALFASFKDYHKVFRSCNVGSKQGIWCCNCPKCLFVYIILSPFMAESELTDIFGEKLLDKESLDRDFRELVGIDENKPFECVGTRREATAAMRYYRARGGRSLLTDRYGDYLDNTGADSADDAIKAMLKEWNDEHALPASLAEMLRYEIMSQTVED